MFELICLVINTNDRKKIFSHQKIFMIHKEEFQVKNEEKKFKVVENFKEKKMTLLLKRNNL